MSASRGKVSRHESEIGRWETVSRSAASRLGQHVLGYCGYEEVTVGFSRRRELPAGEVVLIIGFGPKLETSYPHRAPDRVAHHRSFVAGLHDTHCFVESPGTQAGIQLNLTPLGACLLLGVPMHELTNGVVELDDLLGADGELLVERLHDAPGWEARFELLDSALVRRLDAARPASPDVAWAWRRLIQSGGRLPVGELCAGLGCSRKHLLRRFMEQVGVAPKTYARVLRFQRAVRMLGHRDGASWIDERERGAGRGMGWGEIALECGYFDQAHMNRDFRQFAGASPGELAASLLPDGGGLAG
ncbi:MAG: helix-turn-helix domain-containing protein [Thermoleophilaceae bacterium]